MEAQQTPLRTAIMRLMSDMLNNPCKHGLYNTGKFMNSIEQLLCDMMAAPEVMQLSGSEALFGFAAWLTTREEAVVASARHDASVWANLVGEFCEVNGLTAPREMWSDILIHPTDSVLDQGSPSEGLSSEEPTFAEMKDSRKDTEAPDEPGPEPDPDDRAELKDFLEILDEIGRAASSPDTPEGARDFFVFDLTGAK